MSKAGHRIFAVIAILVIAGFYTKQASAQNPMDDAITRSSTMSYTCSYTAFSCLESPKTHPLEILSNRMFETKKEINIFKTQQTAEPTLANIQIEAQKTAPTIEIIETPAITPSPQAYNETLFVPDNAFVNQDTVFDLINIHRKNAGLAVFEKNESVCQLAKIRSTELAGEITRGILHSGLYNRNLPYWIWENAKVGSDENGTVSWWLHSPIHRASIEGDYKYSCVACTGSYCSELFTSFSPKETQVIAQAKIEKEHVK